MPTCGPHEPYPTLAAVRLVVVGALLVAVAACGGGGEVPARAFRPTRVLDLTHTLTSSFPFIPIPGLTFPFSLTPIATFEKNGVFANRWEIHEHIGTQIDAPNHFAPGGAGLEAFPAESLVVPLAVIDISARAKADADAELTVADITAWEQQHGRLPEKAAVFMYSGWEERVNDAAAFINADANHTMHFPGFSLQAATFLAKERQVSGIGVDTVSIDPGRDKTYATHKAWLTTGKWATEAVAYLREAPPVGATLFVGAPKVQGASGGPVRLIAVW